MAQKCLKAGKHVLQEKPVAQSVEVVNLAIKEFHQLSQQPVWALAENYRYAQCREIVSMLLFVPITYSSLCTSLVDPCDGVTQVRTGFSEGMPNDACAWNHHQGEAF